MDGAATRNPLSAEGFWGALADELNSDDEGGAAAS